MFTVESFEISVPNQKTQNVFISLAPFDFRMKRILLLTSILAVTCLFTQAKELAGSRPNIILVMTDDQGMGDLSALGNPILKTPNLDRFHKLSTRFTESHVSPTCAPTRSAIMSGRHEFRNGVTHTIKERERMALSTTTMPQLLAKAGYETGIFGKWHLGDEDAYQPYNRGFTETFIHGAGGGVAKPTKEAVLTSLQTGFVRAATSTTRYSTMTPS
jgi:hypothetical protein